MLRRTSGGEASSMKRQDIPIMNAEEVVVPAEAVRGLY